MVTKMLKLPKININKLSIKPIDTHPTLLMDLIVSPKRWKQQKAKELGHTP
jgi:hypothetical protein